MFSFQRIVFFAVFAFFLCGFVRAVSMDVAAQEAFDRKWLNGRGQVRFLSLSRTAGGSDKRCSVTYNLQDKTYLMQYYEDCLGTQKIVGIQSVLDCVRESFLKGSVLKKGCEHPAIVGGELSWDAIPWEKYKAEKFGSLFLEKTFLHLLLSHIDSRSSWMSFDVDAFWDMPKKSLVWAGIPRGRSVCWQIVDHENLEQECWREERSETVFFLIVQGLGVLRGSFQARSSYGIHPSSLLAHHLSDEAYAWAFQHKNPFSWKKFESCLNYTAPKCCDCLIL